MLVSPPRPIENIGETPCEQARQSKKGQFRNPDLVEVIRVDPNLKLNIRMRHRTILVRQSMNDHSRSYSDLLQMPFDEE